MIDRTVDLLLKRSEMRIRVSYNVHDNMKRCLETSMKAIVRSRQLLSNSEGLVSHCRSIEIDDPGPLLGRSAQAAKDSPLVSKRDFDYELVSTDGKHFCECVFRNCTLLYSGSEVTFESCQFRDCRFEFSGAAGRTVQFLECFGLLGERSTAPPDSDSAKSQVEFVN